MNAASQWRIDTAHMLGARYAGHPAVRMVVAGGSAARDEADDWSDLDMSVFWDGMDSAWVEEPRLAPEGTRFVWMPIPGIEPEARLEQYFIGDLKVDVAHLPLSWFEGEIRAVQESLDTTPDRQETLEGVHGGVCIYGEAGFADVKSRLNHYPDDLADAMVRRHLQFMPGWALSEQGLGRHDLLVYYEVLLPVLRNVLGVLAGLNQRYVVVSKVKRSGGWLASLQHAPAQAREHFEALLEGRDFESHYEPLCEGVIEMVETLMPQVDTAAARQLLHFPMKPAIAPVGGRDFPRVSP